MTEEIQKIDNIDIAVSGILSLIREHRSEAGDRLPSERDLSERFRVTRNTVREALSVLESMRVIERRPNSGVYVKDIRTESSVDLLVLQADLGLPGTADDIFQAMEVRSLLEVQAIRLACRRRTDSDLEKMRQILQLAERRSAEGQSINEEDEAFHMAIAAATKNSVLRRILAVFYLMSRSRRMVYFSDKERSQRSQLHHHEMYKAIEARDAKESAAIMKQHLKEGAKVWETIFGVKAARPSRGTDRSRRDL
jgi:GntR family transcriptional regulator, transcriptional repressor for pyruvate dehydrogenase complex